MNLTQQKQACIRKKYATTYNKHKQEALLLQRDSATRYVSMFVLFHKLWELERFQSAKVTSNVIQGH